jgi:hypothetical protein
MGGKFMIRALEENLSDWRHYSQPGASVFAFDSMVPA